MNLDFLYERAYNFLNASKFNFFHGFYEVSVMAAEEALYILLNASLLKLGVDIPWYLDFDGLLRILAKYTNNIALEEIRIKEKEIVRTLTDIRIRMGYSIPLEIDKEKTEKILNFTEKIFSLLGRNFFKS
ncbi:MAG: HEPN domain-containing protein [Saccharolobus sp.]|jgi:HEPN domain-containing protein|uniref:HEPN domain-containing protein n=1 Tax=Saccharolobus sp. TaxID=2100761 RepID=UPI0028CE0556|nr:HEPN domain-containing protein [Saccharolobus sp.]MDT7862344.1 HEPN domain-containing protein [Saccharolobus sp.]